MTTTPTTPHFSEMRAEPVDLDAARAAFDALHEALDAATSVEDELEVIRRWDALRSRRYTWRSLSNLRFNQDTTDADYRAAREACDALMPKLSSLDNALIKRLLESPRRAQLEAAIGDKVFLDWAADVEGFSPAIEEHMAEQSKLRARYVELLATARLEVRGETVTLSTLPRLTTDPDRSLRHEAEAARWDWMASVGDELDALFDRFVGLRHEMAETLGYETFTELGYRWMHRLDYDADDVERFRAQVREHVVPLAAELREEQRERLGVDTLYFWDEGVHDPEGEPAPQGDHDALVAAAQRAFDDFEPSMAEFYRMMNARGLLDLDSRDTKAGGGFCTYLLDFEVPFVFANFNGTHGDIRVFTHEMGHAFQAYTSRHLQPLDTRSPSADACEIHSMSLEFLTWPQMEHFFGDEAERYRRNHLTRALFFIPYGTAVDHFQHLVYANPTASPEERHEMWLEMERTYLPWRDYGDLDYPARGGFWQRQRHIYAWPFYYIDYVLAQTCALQFWERSLSDREGALEDYVALCARGGSRPFQDLVRSAHLVSPFDEGCLERVVRAARDHLT